MDHGHFNCRDYYVSPHFAAPTIVTETTTPAVYRHESFDELERRSRSPEADKPKFPLMRLPLELRQHILSFLLPHTQEFKDSGRLSEHVRNFSAVRNRGARGMPVPTGDTTQATASNVVWQRGNINVMSVCKQLHDECAELVYGRNTFLLFITYRGIQWRYRWLLPSGLAPYKSYTFLEILPQQYMRLIKRVVVYVDHVDSYMGMIKFNVGGKGLIHGLKRQVQRLAIALGAGQQDSGDETDADRRLAKISIVLESSQPQRGRGTTDSSKDLQDILEPFSYLRGVRHATVGGAVSPQFAEELIRTMKSTEPCATMVKSLLDEGMSTSNEAGGVQLCVYGNDI
ncbi:hypothetical protein BDY17DRAFT_296130 [Neohortaea acidophila]|uniref:F-box domain-containing protein n=1 Tax=Neohortaea acidophila TaxID=245834 RepID=A0A6A6PZ07_9PEZI|nr:uncharacterized protein BDY17DRAFT_296130 [Neohortaea acidophila]KAF2484683.1 hypothetical protein BDY17DRAFT_296130 [Neohortaea acidophila]